MEHTYLDVSAKDTEPTEQSSPNPMGNFESEKI